MNRLTLLTAKSYDRLRSLRGMATCLKLEQATATGYTQVGQDITAGWYVEFTEDRIIGEQSMQVLLVESSEWETSDMGNLVSAVVFNERRYKLTGKRPPEAAPMVWILKANATGELV
jgi:hypothetical protein